MLVRVLHCFLMLMVMSTCKPALKITQKKKKLRAMEKYPLLKELKSKGSFSPFAKQKNNISYMYQSNVVRIREKVTFP